MHIRHLGCLAVVSMVGVVVSDPGFANAAESPFDRLKAEYERELPSRRGKAAAAGPLSALLRLEGDLAQGALVETLSRLAADEGTDPLVRGMASYHLAREEARKGDGAAAAARIRGLGFGVLDDVWVVGPFDAQGRSGLGRAYPPEGRASGPKDGDRFAGKEREVGWRRVRGLTREGALLLDGILRPENEAVAYVMVAVHSPRAQAAALRLGSAGPVAVWLNGESVFTRDVVRTAAPDQDAAGVRLRAGRNVLVIKAVVTTQRFRLFARFTDTVGRPLPQLGFGTDDLLAWPKPIGRPFNPPKVRALGTDLRLTAERGGTEASWLDWIRYEAQVRSEDNESKGAEKAARRLAESGGGVEAWALLSDLSAEENVRRPAFQRVVMGTEDGRAGLALVALGDLERGRQRQGAALALWTMALARDPTSYPAVLAIAMDEHLAGFPAVARLRLEALPPEIRGLYRVRSAYARILDEQDHKNEAQGERLAMVAGRASDVGLLMDLATAALRRQDRAEAIRLYGEALSLRPDLHHLAIERASLMEGAGEFDEAYRILKAATELCPDEVRLHEELGRLLVRADRVAEGIEELRGALALKPQNPSLRRYVERLASEQGGTSRGGAELATTYAEDVTPLVKAVVDNPVKDAPALVLLDRRVVRVHPNGLSESFWQRVVRVQTDRAARDNQEFFVRYTPGTQEVDIRRAQVYRRDTDGTFEVSEATGRDDRDLSEPWYGLYYDTRAEVITFEGLKAGDVIELQYKVSDVSTENMMADYFGDLEFIAEAAPKLRWDYTLIGPSQRNFFFNEPRLPGLKKTVETRGKETVYRFEARDVPRVDAEPAMPGWTEVAPYLHVSTYRSWEDVGRWYWHLVQDQLASDPTLIRAASSAVAGAFSLEDKVRGLHKFVVETTRYVGLEFGIHGFKPYRVSQVLERQFGDCKDKAALFVALAREVGIDAHLVLLRTRRGGMVDPVPASLAVFDHAIAYVPVLDIYVDGTAEFSGLRELPSQDQGVMALRLEGGKGKLVQIPVLPSAANRVRRTWAAEVSATGSANVREEITITGQAAAEWREHYQVPGERADRYTKVWNARFPGTVVSGTTWKGIEDRGALAIGTSAQIPQLAHMGEPGTLALPVTVREVEFVRSYARLGERHQELVVAYPWQHEEEILFTIPSGWHVLRKPETRREEGPFGRFELEVSSNDQGAIRVRSLVDVRTHRIAPGDYAAFRRFLRTIDGALAERVTLQRDK